MKEYEEQQGVSFLIIFFTHRNKYYYLRFSELKTYMDRVNEGHAKNFKYEELNPDFFIHAKMEHWFIIWSFSIKICS